jgi:hypothetical protein
MQIEQKDNIQSKLKGLRNPHKKSVIINNKLLF